MWGNSAKLWKTVLTGRLLGGRRPISSPLMRIEPAVGSSSPATIRRVVVLPQPDGPSREKNSPSPMVRLTSSTAVTSVPDRSPNRLTTPVNSTAGRCPFVPASIDAGPPRVRPVARCRPSRSAPRPPVPEGVPSVSCDILMNPSYTCQYYDGFRCLWQILRRLPLSQRESARVAGERRPAPTVH